MWYHPLIHASFCQAFSLLTNISYEKALSYQQIWHGLQNQP